MGRGDVTGDGGPAAREFLKFTAINVQSDGDCGNFTRRSPSAGPSDPPRRGEEEPEAGRRWEKKVSEKFQQPTSRRHTETF